VSWAAVGAVLFSVLAIVCAAYDRQALTIAFGLGAITWAILSLKQT